MYTYTAVADDCMLFDGTAASRGSMVLKVTYFNVVCNTQAKKAHVAAEDRLLVHLPVAGAAAEQEERSCVAYGRLIYPEDQNVAFQVR